MAPNYAIAAVMAFFLGNFGVHKFYLGKPIQGLLYIAFSWTFIPAVIALVESIVYVVWYSEEQARRQRGGT